MASSGPGPSSARALPTRSPSVVIRRVAPAGKRPFSRSRAAAGVSSPGLSVCSAWMWRSSMAEEESRVGAAEGVARADDAVEGPVAKALPRHALGHGRSRPPDGPRRPAGAHGLDRDRELDEAAAAQGVAQAPLPPDDRRPGEAPAHGGDLELAGLERAGSMALEPDPAAARRRGDTLKAAVEPRAVAPVGGELVHLVVDALARECPRAPPARYNREGGPVAEADCAGVSHPVGRRKA